VILVRRAKITILSFPVSSFQKHPTTHPISMTNFQDILPDMQISNIKFPLKMLAGDVPFPFKDYFSRDVDQLQLVFSRRSFTNRNT